MIPDDLRKKEQQIRNAIARVQYKDVLQQIELLRRSADEHIAALEPGDVVRLQIAAWMLDTMKWGRLMLATQRQVCASNLERLPRISQYTQGRYLDHAGPLVKALNIDL